MVRAGLIEKVEFEKRRDRGQEVSHEAIWRKQAPGRKDHPVQRPHMEVCLCLWAVRRSAWMEQMSKGRKTAGSDGEKGGQTMEVPADNCKDLGFILSNMGSIASDR